MLLGAGAAVAEVIIGINAVSTGIQRCSELQIAQRVLANPVNELHHSARLVDGPCVVMDAHATLFGEGAAGDGIALAHGLTVHLRLAPR